MGLEWENFPHLTEHHRELAEHLAKGLGEQALADVLGRPPEQQKARLEQFEAFVLAQRAKTTERAQAQAQAQSQEMAAFINKTREQLSIDVARNEALAKAVESLSSRPPKRVPIKMDAPKFDGSDGNTLVHWLLAVERCGVAQLIEDESQMVSYALSNLRGKASEWAYSTLLSDANAFPTWAIFNEKIRSMYQPPNNEVLLQARFFGARQGSRSLHQYVQEMRTLCASITVQPLPESVKVPAFMNGLRQGAARQALFRKIPATMEDAIAIAFVEEQSFNTGNKPGGDRPTPKPGPTPMDLGSADVVCYNCGKRGHVKARCYAKPKTGAQGRSPNQRNHDAKKGGVPHARRTGGQPTTSGSGNARRQ